MIIKTFLLNMITVITNYGEAKVFTTKAQAARYCGITAVTLSRWQRLLKEQNRYYFEHYSKKKKKYFTIYPNTTVIRKTDEL